MINRDQKVVWPRTTSTKKNLAREGEKYDVVCEIAKDDDGIGIGQLMEGNLKEAPFTERLIFGRKGVRDMVAAMNEQGRLSSGAIVYDNHEVFRMQITVGTGTTEFFCFAASSSLYSFVFGRLSMKNMSASLDFDKITESFCYNQATTRIQLVTEASQGWIS